MPSLYGYYRSTAAYRVRIACHYKNIDVEHVPVHLVRDGGEQHKPTFLEKNPQGLVPCFQDGEEAFTQSLAILEYLEERYPEPGLLPVAPEARAHVRAMAQLVACEMHPLNNLRVLQYLKRELQVTDEVKMQWYHHWIQQGFTALEKLVQQYSADGKYCFGDALSIADLCLIPQIYNANRFDCDMSAYPCLNAVNEHCIMLDFFRKAHPSAQSDAPSE